MPKSLCNFTFTVSSAFMGINFLRSPKEILLDQIEIFIP
jgi:hypothetical protein